MEHPAISNSQGAQPLFGVDAVASARNVTSRKRGIEGLDPTVGVATKRAVGADPSTATDPLASSKVKAPSYGQAQFTDGGSLFGGVQAVLAEIINDLQQAASDVRIASTDVLTASFKSFTDEFSTYAAQSYQAAMYQAGASMGQGLGQAGSAALGAASLGGGLIHEYGFANSDVSAAEAEQKAADLGLLNVKQELPVAAASSAKPVPESGATAADDAAAIEASAAKDGNEPQPVRELQAEQRVARAKQALEKANQSKGTLWQKWMMLGQAGQIASGVMGIVGGSLQMVGASDTAAANAADKEKQAAAYMIGLNQDLLSNTQRQFYDALSSLTQAAVAYNSAAVA